MTHGLDSTTLGFVISSVDELQISLIHAARRSIGGAALPAIRNLDQLKQKLVQVFPAPAAGLLPPDCRDGSCNPLFPIPRAAADGSAAAGAAAAASG